MRSPERSWPYHTNLLSLLKLLEWVRVCWGISRLQWYVMPICRKRSIIIDFPRLELWWFFFPSVVSFGKSFWENRAGNSLEIALTQFQTTVKSRSSPARCDANETDQKLKGGPRMTPRFFRGWFEKGWSDRRLVTAQWNFGRQWSHWLEEEKGDED